MQLATGASPNRTHYSFPDSRIDLTDGINPLKSLVESYRYNDSLNSTNYTGNQCISLCGN